MDYTDYTVDGILQARILEWVAFPFSRGSSQPRDRTQVSCISGGFFTSWATREAQVQWLMKINKKKKANEDVSVKIYLSPNADLSPLPECKMRNDD